MLSIQIPLSFTRQYAGPLDATVVFDTLNDLNLYITSDSTAYAGQVVSVSSGIDAGIYIISENVDSVIKQAAVDDINLQSVTDNNNVTTNDIQVANLSADGDIYSGSAFTGDVIVGGDTILSIRGGLIRSVTSVESSTSSTSEEEPSTSPTVSVTSTPTLTPSISTSVTSTVAPTPTPTPTSTPTPTPTLTPTLTSTPASTPTPTSTPTLTPTPTSTPTLTPNINNFTYNFPIQLG